MRMHSICLAAGLLLGGMAAGYAQDGPPSDKGMEIPSSAGQGAFGSTDEPRGRGSAAREDREAQRSDQESTRSNQESAGKSAERPRAREAREENGGEQKRRRAAAERDSDEDSGKPSGAKRDSRAADRAGDKGTESGSRGDTAEDTRDDTDGSQKTESGDRKERGQAQKSEDDSKDGRKRTAVGDRELDTAKDVELSSDKKVKVRTAFGSVTDAKRETDIDVNVSIGTRLPRHLNFHPVPVVVIEIVPEYRDYVFVYVDDRYVICDPETYEVVAIIDASEEGGYRTTAGGGAEDACPSDLILTESEEELLLSSIRLEDEEDFEGVSVGWSVPQSVDLKTLPDPIVSRYGKLSGCRYFIVEDQIALVDPDDDEVVLLVEVKD